MDHIAYSHLYLAYEQPSQVREGNWHQLTSKILFCLPSVLTVVSVLGNVTTSLAALSDRTRDFPVVELQNRLKELGYFPKNVKSTGFFGTITQEALAEFQCAHNLLSNGILDSETLAKLESSEAQPYSPQISIKLLKLGSSNGCVKQLQLQLAALGYYRGKINGKFEYSTQVAVQQFQQDSSLEADGIVGAVTRKALNDRVKDI